MESFTIGFSKSVGFKPFSWAIRKFEGTDYSHTYIKFYSTKYNRWMIYQASKSMVNFMSESVFLNHNQIVDEINIAISDEQRSNLVQFGIDQCGKPYSIKAIIGIFLKSFGIHIKSLFDNDAGYICSELVGRTLNQVLYTKINNLDQLTPKEIHDIAKGLV